MKQLFFILIIALISTTTMKADEARLLEIADILKEVESNNNPEAIGDGGKAFGVLQIHQGCITDVNEYYGTSYTHEDAKNPLIAEDIFIKYISLGIKLYTEKCGYPPSEYEIVRMWNGGIYKGYLYTDTLPYLDKYLAYKGLEQFDKNVIPVSDMPKYLTKNEAVSKFKLEFLPMVKQQYGDDENEMREAWDYWKQSLYDNAQITTAGLRWKFPEEELS